MRCPKCDEGVIRKITFKKTGEDAYLCSNCETTWMIGENITANSGHLLDAFTKNGDMEYVFTIDENPDQTSLEEDEQEDEKDLESPHYLT